MYISMYLFEACLGCIMMWKKCLLKVNMYSIIQLDPHQAVCNGCLWGVAYHWWRMKFTLLYTLNSSQVNCYFFKEWSEHSLKKKKEKKIREKEKKWSHRECGTCMDCRAMGRTTGRPLMSLYIHLKGGWFFMELEVEGGPDTSFIDI